MRETICIHCGRTIYFDDDSGIWSTSRVFFEMYCEANEGNHVPTIEGDK